MYKNRRDPTTHQPSHNPIPTRIQKLAEEEITSQTNLLLHELRRQLGRTQWQTSLDRYITLVGPRFAFDNMGRDRLSLQWKPGARSFKSNWWYIFQLEVVSRIVVLYFDAIREKDIPPWKEAMTRLREMLVVGVHKYKVVRVDKTSFTLKTPAEQADQKGTQS